MDKGCILFDDWAARIDGVYKSRKREFIVCSIFATLMLVVSAIGVFFEWSVILTLIISLVVGVSITLEWLKVKHNHLIIREKQIEITNRFQKTIVYPININNVHLELRHSFNSRSGGIIMEFFDSDGNPVCRYEDMLNRAAPWGATQTNWEKDIKALGIRIIDPEDVIMNK